MNLKLIAKTEEDLRVVSAHLQDSIASVADIANLKKNKIFLMQLNRFMWEDVEKGVFRKNKRIRTVLKFENVLKVLSKKGMFSNGKKYDKDEIFLLSMKMSTPIQMGGSRFYFCPASPPFINDNQSVKSKVDIESSGLDGNEESQQKMTGIDNKLNQSVLNGNCGKDNDKK